MVECIAVHPHNKELFSIKKEIKHAMTQKKLNAWDAIRYEMSTLYDVNRMTVWERQSFGCGGGISGCHT